MSDFTEQPKDFVQYDYIEEDSDQECHGRDSSDDELDILLHGTPNQKRRLERSISRGSLEMSSSEDEFEKEMEKELDETMRQHEQRFGTAVSSAIGMTSEASSSTMVCNPQSDVQPSNSESRDVSDFYNDIYFDSDEETQEGASTSATNKTPKNKKSPGKHRVLSNDELLYDPDIDDRNQEWVDKQRQRYYPSHTTQAGSSSQTDGSCSSPTASSSENDEGAQKKGPAIPKSDAVLNCPACMTTLCLDCQRHELYPHQFRAIFVLNCTIVRAERLTYNVPLKMGRKKWRGKKNQKMQVKETEGESSTAPEAPQAECYHPVRCSRCNTEVAVYDNDEVFHFFNVLTSLS